MSFRGNNRKNFRGNNREKRPREESAQDSSNPFLDEFKKYQKEIDDKHDR